LDLSPFTKKLRVPDGITIPTRLEHGDVVARRPYYSNRAIPGTA
jgi:hypothetical protein